MKNVTHDAESIFQTDPDGRTFLRSTPGDIAEAFVSSPVVPAADTAHLGSEQPHGSPVAVKEKLDNWQYLSVTETAKILRQNLKREFPDVKFSVKSDKYAGGASINVGWTDGPVNKKVDAILSSFMSARFDGSIDMQISVKHWLLPDGTAIIADSSGTQGSLGCIPAEYNGKPCPEAVLVYFGSDYIFGRRTYSRAFVTRVATAIAKRWGVPVPEITGTDDEAWVKFSHEHVKDTLRSFSDLLHEAFSTTAATDAEVTFGERG